MQPEIRFNGFSDEWVEKKLDDSEIRVVTGKLNANAATANGKYPFFTTALETYMTDSYSFDDDAILIAGNGNLGFVKEYSGKFDAYQREYVLTNFEGYVKSYLVSYFKHSLSDHISHSSKGSAMPYITKDVLESFLIASPSFPEQQKIGALFSKYDAIIALREQKLAELNALKKGMLQQMFPKNGEKVPELRFAGFVDDWEERKLINYTKLITKGTTPKDKTGSGIVNFVKVENLSDGKILPIQKITEEEHEGYLKRSRLEEGDILFSIAGTLGRTAIVNKLILPANTNQALAIIRSYDFDKYFLVTTLTGHVVAEYIRKNPTVGAQPNLSLEQVGKLIINTPIKGEQQKIGQLFKHLDARISNEQSKLDQLKGQKQGLLQRML